MTSNIPGTSLNVEPTIDPIRAALMGISPPPPPDPNFVSSIPDVATLFLRTSLYEDISISIDDRSTLENLQRNRYQFDGFCVRCVAPSIFRGGTDPTGRDPSSSYGPTANWMFGTSYFFAQAFCQRCGASYICYFLVGDGNLTKIGQLPSLEDIGSIDSLRYKNLLDGETAAELKRAGGLFSHGIGIGSFVYLRRIFERLISKYYDQYKLTNSHIPDWEKKRVVERIGALKSALPPAIVKHKSTYGILSKGVHELDEATCRKYFPVVRAAIIQMLEQDLRKKEEALAEQSLEQELAAISEEIRPAKS